jgi:hypothetical protein
MTIGGAGIAATLGIDATAGAATTAAAHAKVVAPQRTSGRAAQQQSVPSVLKGHIGRSGPAVAATPDVPRATAASKTFTVDTTNDANLATKASKTCVASTATGLCTLRAAIEAADNDAGHVDTVKVPAGTYDLSTAKGLGTLYVYNSMIIDGPSTGSAVVSGHTHHFEDIEVYEDITGFSPAVEISDLTVTDGGTGGFTEGGDIGLFGAALTLSGDTITDGEAYQGGDIAVDGGSLWADSATTISTSTAFVGGGIWNTLGAVFIGGSTLTKNSAYVGAAVIQNGSMVTEGATFSNNSGAYGGAVYNGGTWIDSDSTYTDNHIYTTSGAPTQTKIFGGDVDNVWIATISGSTFTGTANEVTTTETINGGVLYNGNVMTLDDVTVSDTSTPCGHCVVLGGVVDTSTTTNKTYGGSDTSALTIDGLTVTGTSNGTTTGHAKIEGGVVLNSESHATLSGLDISKTTNDTKSNDIYGGALTTYDVSEVTGSTITNTVDNGAGDSEVAGAAQFTAATTVTGLSISGTSITVGTDATVEGGALYDGEVGSLHDVSIEGTTIRAAGAEIFGGALFTTASSGVQDTTISGTTIKDEGTHGELAGGGWFNVNALTASDDQVLDTTVATNANMNGGAFDSAGTGPATIADSTFAGTTVDATGTNDVYGGVAAFTAGATLTNVTMDDSTTTAKASAVASILDVETAVQLTNDTIANDTLKTSTGGALGHTQGGVRMTGTQLVAFKNTIVATTPATANCNDEGSDIPFVSAGGNIDSGSSCGFTQSSDQSTTNPKVAAVAANGGSVETAALEYGSPAIGHGVTAGAPSNDARGFARHAGHIDVGAFQTSGQGYWEVASDGGVFTFGTATFYGSMGGTPLVAPVVGIAATPDQGGYWEVASDGGVFAFGDAQFHGSMGGIKLNAPVVGIAAAPTGKGYWEVASDGGVFAFGTATFYGSMGGKKLNAPVVGIAAAPTGDGYWEVASDGGIFNFGTAAGFHGSMGGKALNAPVVGIAAAPTGDGYSLVASDGGIFDFGPGAGFYGSMGGKKLNAPVVGIADTPDGGGYWEFAADGGIFNFGDAGFTGSMGGKKLNAPVVGGAGFERR